MTQMVPKMITLHCTDSVDGVPVPVQTIREWHLKRGFSDIGYHFVVQPDGRVDTGRSMYEVGAHVEGHNTSNIGIALVGRSKFTFMQFDALKRFLGGLKWHENIPDWELYAHYEFDSAKKQHKSCPNMDIKRLLVWILTGNINSIDPYLIKQDHV